MERNNLFPVFLKLESLETLIVGGGHVGLEKLTALLKNSPSAKITLVARAIGEPIKELARKHTQVKLFERNFKLWDLWDKDLVLLATDNRQLHETIRNFARTRRLLINVADTPDLCDFYLGSVVTKGNLKIGVSTNGKSPTISKRIREYLEDALPDNTNELLDNMQKIRDQIKGDFSKKVQVLNDVTASFLERGGA
ncbi:precorrin-2 dehydrogenase/sirohydrochlorin ferrochelatase family protein [Pseudochryseolinea flava]|uniref:precorrin-2 dehydrogenase n=1 Tax=Pseudochryseolinea flava TaxID=2059302 RepID=A0A364XX05_9BACT|nr:bifunctional precorrin-2 dehydrogenase/sirohydrochlorin ferrochelatase [Pseudochryseolinea flava]RAV98766.1 bifunctional precorrin-2 dehydrogenase/sirohydrochlorin ferrochelatase [Pseudochryseolinea flava]